MARLQISQSLYKLASLVVVLLSDKQLDLKVCENVEWILRTSSIHTLASKSRSIVARGRSEKTCPKM